MRALSTPRFWRAALAGSAALVLLILSPSSSVAQEKSLTGDLDPAIKQEIEYAGALNEMGMSDYAQIVIERIKDPRAASYLKVVKLQGLLALGKFDDVKAIIAKEPNQDSQDTWAMKLALADGFYAWGRYGEAQGIYESLLQKYPSGPPEGLKEFFINSMYKYAQMLILMGKNDAAVKAYDEVGKVVPATDTARKHVRRQVLGETAELLVKLAETAKPEQLKGYADRINAICTELLWVQDLWFGKAIVYLAHLRMIQGNTEGAQKLVEDYREQLNAVDESLKDMAQKTGEDLTKLSPMAQCRYLLGVIMQTKAEKLLEGGNQDKKARQEALELLAGKEAAAGKRSPGALQHFLNVFIRYPFTQWAPDAGVRAQKVEEMLKNDFGAKIQTNVTDEQKQKVRTAQFQGARALFNQQQFAQAVEAYRSVLALFPEEEDSITAIGEMARSYVELQDELYAETAIRYLAERFCRNKDRMSAAGDEVLRLAEFYGERNLPEKKDAVYDLFFTLYQKHPLAAGTRFRFGEDRFKEKDYQGAISYFLDVSTNFTSSPLYLDTLNRLAVCYSELDRPADEIKTLTRYTEELLKTDKPGHALINAKYRLAAAYRKLGPRYVPSAFNRYSEIIKLLADPAPYQKTPEETENNTKILEAALYYKGVCYAQLTEPKEKQTAYKEEAIKALEEFVQKFPKSAMAPPALSQIGAIWTVLENPDNAQKTLDRLQKQYPDSQEAKNALFMLGRTLLELGRKQQAIEVFKRMFASTGQYTASQILTAGNELFKVREFDIALQAYERVLAMSQDKTTKEPALLGKGKVLVDTGKQEAGAAVLEGLLKEFPNSGYTVEVCFYLSRAYSELGMKEPDANKRFEVFNNGVKAMKTFRKYVQSPGERARSDVAVGRILTQKARAETQFGSKEKAKEYLQDAIATYQSLILLTDSNNPEVRPHLEDAYNDCTPLLLEVENWENALEDCDKYLTMFPRGKYVVDISKWRNTARVKLVASGQSVPEAAAPSPAAGGKPAAASAAPAAAK